jgi:hypothetical protein
VAAALTLASSLDESCFEGEDPGDGDEVEEEEVGE